MTERSLYALLGILIGWLTFPPPAAAGQTACALCIAVTITPGQALLLPDDLYGLRVLVRDHGDTVESVRSATAAVEARGGVPGVVVPLFSDTADAAQRVYRLRLRLTELRAGLGSGVLLAIEGQHPGDVSGYADVRIGDGGDPALPVWTPLEAATADAALAATTRGGASQWVIQAPSDALDARSLLHALASAAAPPPDAFTEEVEVQGARRLTADEIVARHQAAARRQALAVHHTIATGTLALTFEAPGFPAPMTITSTTVIYAAPGRTELEQRDIRVNGVAFPGGGVPRLPILEPERVAAVPLTISLTRAYRYRLDGEDVIDGIRCHVVAFEPLDPKTPLFTGRAWIAMDGFALVRVAAAQTGLRGAIVSSEQVDDYRERAPGIWMLVRSDVRQLYEGAAHRTPIQRLLTLTAHEINPPVFEARLREAYGSAAVMLRDTPDGYRYLRLDRRGAGGDPAAAAAPEVAPRSDRVRTLAAGVILDPNISIPLPFAGLSYVDFNLFDTGTQFTAFFGGSYAQAAFSIPSLRGTAWQLAGRAFGIASSYNDRAFRDGREIYDENLRQRPAHVSAWLLRPLSPRLTLRAGYDFDYTRLTAADSTAASFVVPADHVVHGARLALEGQRAGWSGSLWWNPAVRAGWRAWGRTAGRTEDAADDETYRPSQRTFQRFGATVARSAVLTTRVTTRIEGAVMGGRDLDRFSRYAFGTFDNRLRGYPSALVRYDRGGVVRGAVAWASGRFARLDGFLDVARVRDRGYGRRYRTYTGVGAALEAPAPFGLLTAAEWGYGFRGLNADGSQGTHVIRLSAYKIF